MVGLGEPEAAHPLAGREPREELLALRLGAVGVDRVHDEARLDAHHGAVARIDGLDLARDEPVGRVVGPRASVAVDGAPEEAERAELPKEAAVHPLLPERLDHPGQELLAGERPGRVAHHPLFLGEGRFERERVGPVEDRAPCRRLRGGGRRRR